MHSSCPPWSFSSTLALAPSTPRSPWDAESTFPTRSLALWVTIKKSCFTMKMIPEDFHGFPGTVLLRYFMPMGDVGGKVAVAFGVLFVLLVVGVALKEVMDWAAMSCEKKAAKIPAAFLNCCWNSILKRWKLGFETITNLVSPLVPRRRCQQSWRWQIFWLINAKTKWVMLSCTETPRCFQNRPLWHSLIILAFWHFQSSTDFWRCSWSTVKSALSFPMAPAEFCVVS